MNLCIPKSIVDKVRTAIKSGDINLEKLYSMDNDEAHTLFENYVGKDNATLVNAEYQKAKIAATKKAAADYITATDKASFTQKATGGEFGKKLLPADQVKQMTLDKIDQKIKDVQAKQKVVAEKVSKTTGEDKANAQIKLDKLKDQETRLNIRRSETETPSTDRFVKKLNAIKGLLGDEDYNDLVKAKMGQDISPAQGDYIVKKTTELQELAKDNPSSSFGATPEYIAARNNLDDYISSLEPTSPLSIVKNATEIARNFLITGFSTPIKVLANYLNHPAGALVRRIADMSVNGDNGDLTKALKKEDVAFTKKTGTSSAQMTNINDSSTVLGSRETGPAYKNETFNKPSVGVVKGALGLVEKGIEKAAQASRFVAIKLEHQLAFNYVYRSTFYDILNLRASDMAKTEGLKGEDMAKRARDIIRDAAKIEPTTDAGKNLRATAQAGAARITNTNDSYASRVSVGIKNGLNSISPDVPIGDLIEPMAKIPANVISNGIENTPAGIPKALFDIVKGRINLSADKNLETRYEGLQQYKNGVESAIRIFGSLGIAALITSQLTSKDFRSDQYGSHFMKFGDLWINTEYLARLSPDIAGLMAIKMNPTQNPLKEFATGNALGQGSLGGLLNIPGIGVGTTLAQGVLGKNPESYIGGAIGSRVPSIFLNLSKSRPFDRVLFGANGVETTEDVAQDTKVKAAKAAATRKADKAAK